MSFDDYLYERLAEVYESEMDRRAAMIIEGDLSGEPMGIEPR